MNTESATVEPSVSRWRWWIHLVLIGGYFVPAIPLGLVHVRHRAGLTSTAHGFLIICGFELLAFSIVFFLGWFASRASSEDLLLKWRPGWAVVPLGIVYSIAMRLVIMTFAVLLAALLLGTGLVSEESLRLFSTHARPDVERLVDISALQSDPFYFWLTVILGSFAIAGLREELWRAGTLAAIRVLWPNTFGDRDGQIAAVAIIAIVFGLAHLSMGVFAAALAIPIGFFLGITMVVHKSIWPAVFAHGFWDATTFGLLPLIRHAH